MKWLAEQGIITYRTWVTEFWHWYRCANQIEEAAVQAACLHELLKKAPQLVNDASRLSLACQALYEMKAMQREDFEQYVALRRLRQEDDRALDRKTRLAQQAGELELDRVRERRTTCEEFKRWYGIEKTRKIMESDFDNSELIERLGQQMFGPNWRDDGTTPAPAAEPEGPAAKVRQRAEAALAEIFAHR